MSTIEDAGAWLASTPRGLINQPVIGELRKRFGLSAADAVKAIDAANILRRNQTCKSSTTPA